MRQLPQIRPRCPDGAARSISRSLTSGSTILTCPPTQWIATALLSLRSRASASVLLWVAWFCVSRLPCVETALPVVRAKKAISLERQVRIAAGSLVLLGAVLGWFVNPAIIGLSAFVGAGLLFSGIAHTCGMGMVLTRLPWNQVPKVPATSAEPGTKTSSSKSPNSFCG